MTEALRERAPWYLWPLAAIADLAAFLVVLTGRLLAGLCGLVLMVLGVALCLTVIGLPLGIPILILGFLLVLRSVF